MSADRDQLGLFGDNPEYDAFTEKFKPKKTTDDCYTPPKVYETIAEWVREEYRLGAAPFLRPFHPDGDYLHETYPEGAVVVDNPPFSILAQIVRFYTERQIPFFLFAPALTLLTRRSDVCHIAVGVSIVYANGAEVPTSFVTNLDKRGCILRTAPELYRRIDAAVRAIRAEGAKELPRYAYPDHIVTAAMAQRWSRYGVEYRLQAAECMRVAGLDAQKPFGKSIFGGGVSPFREGRRREGRRREGRRREGRRREGRRPRMAAKHPRKRVGADPERSRKTEERMTCEESPFTAGRGTSTGI